MFFVSLIKKGLLHTYINLKVILAVGTKLQGIISQMAMEIKERHVVIQGIPLVQVSDSYFWFNRPQLVLRLIHFVLFQVTFTFSSVLYLLIFVCERLLFSS